MPAGLRQRLLRPGRAVPVDLQGRRVVVTGASEGSLGYETAHALASWGAEVVVTRRSGAQHLRAAAARAGDARVVNVASHLHRKATNADLFVPHHPYNSWVAYGASKLAMVHTAFELERRFGAEGLHGYALHPGAVFTNVAGKGLAGHGALTRVRDWLAPVERYFLLTPEEGAQTSLHCATHAALEGGQYFTACVPARASVEAVDAEVAARLWDSTAAWVDAVGA